MIVWPGVPGCSKLSYAISFRVFFDEEFSGLARYLFVVNLLDATQSRAINSDEAENVSAD